MLQCVSIGEHSVWCGVEDIAARQPPSCTARPNSTSHSTQPRGGKKIHSEEEPSKNQTQVNKRCQQHELVLQHTPCLNVSERQWEKVAGLGAANGGSREDKKEWPSTLESVSQQALHNTPNYSTDQHF